MFKFKYVAALLVVTNICFGACEEDQVTEQKQPAKTIDRHESAEVLITQKTGDTSYLITTNTTYYDKQGHAILSTTHRDSLPYLELTRDTLDTGRTREDENGDDQPIDTIITHRKSYQFFITVK